MNRRLPWQDAAGNLLSDDKLRFVSRNWTVETWEAYLFHLETKQSEYLSRHYDTLIFKKDRSGAIDYFNDEDKDESQSRKIPFDLESAFQNLTEQERQVVQAVFYDGFTQTEAAHLMNFSIPRAHAVLRRAIQKLRSAAHNAMTGGGLKPELAKRVLRSQRFSPLAPWATFLQA